MIKSRKLATSNGITEIEWVWLHSSATTLLGQQQVSYTEIQLRIEKLTTDDWFGSIQFNNSP